MIVERMFQWLLDRRSPLPRGLCVIELLGHVRIRGTIRRRWALIEVTSQEPDEEGQKSLHGPAAFYSIREMAAEEKRWLTEDQWRAEAKRVRHAHVVSDGPKYTHSSCGSTKTWCGIPSAGLRVSDEQYDCPHCKAMDDDIPF